MKLRERIKAYVVNIIREETQELENRENLLEGNVKELNAAIELQETIAENVRNLNAIVEGYGRLEENVRNLNVVVGGFSRLEENVRNLNVAIADQEAVAENVRNLNAMMAGYNGLEENVRNLNAVVEGFNRLEENVRNLNVAIVDQEAIAENVRNLNAMMEGYNGLEENVRNLNAVVEGFNRLEENVRNLNTMLDGYEKVIGNLNNNNSMIETIHSTLEMQKVKLAMLEKAKITRHNWEAAEEKNIKEVENIVTESAENIYSGIDYFDFENYFRGSIDLIKRHQQQYIKYYKEKDNVVDLGCGRGEFLELLSENGINAKGVDLYDEFAEMCQMHGLNVVCDDALHFLREQQKVGGIFAGQLIEHLSVNQLVELCRLAYEKLEEDAYIIMETPNPTCLAIYSHAFYIDPSHNKPVHPLTVKYILEKSGFTKIEILYTETSKLPVSIPAISGIEDADKFNNAMHIVSESLFGSQDYAVIARK